MEVKIFINGEGKRPQEDPSAPFTGLNTPPMGDERWRCTKAPRMEVNIFINGALVGDTGTVATAAASSASVVPPTPAQQGGSGLMASVPMTPGTGDSSTPTPMVDPERQRTQEAPSSRGGTRWS